MFCNHCHVHKFGFSDISTLEVLMSGGDIIVLAIHSACLLSETGSRHLESGLWQLFMLWVPGLFCVGWLFRHLFGITPKLSHCELPEWCLVFNLGATLFGLWLGFIKKESWVVAVLIRLLEVHMSPEWWVWQLAGRQKSISGQTRGCLFWWEAAGHQCLAGCSGATGRQVEIPCWAQIITSSLG